MAFIEHCKSLGIELLREDVMFIRERLKRIPKSSHRTVLTRYCELWCRIMRECDSDVCGMNLGRRSANSFLREL